MWIDCEGAWAGASTPCSQCYSVPLHGGSRDGERLVALIFSQKEASASSLSIPSPWASCVTGWCCAHLHGCLKLGNWIQTHIVQGEGATDRKQKEKLNPPWRQGKSLPGIWSSTKLFWSNFWHADRPRQLFLDYKLRACSCLWTTWSSSFPGQGDRLMCLLALE